MTTEPDPFEEGQRAARKNLLLAHDPPKCERFGAKIMRPSKILERDRTQNRIPLLLIALYG